MTYSVNISQPLSQPPVLSQWLHKLNDYGSKDGGDVWDQQHGLTKADVSTATQSAVGRVLSLPI